MRQAQLAMLRGEVRLEGGQLVIGDREAGRDRILRAVPLPPAVADLGDRNLIHPYYWSAFRLIGNPW